MVTLRRLFHLALALTLLCGAVLRGIDQHLLTGASPRGIVSFELCGLAEGGCDALLRAWDGATRQWALFSLGIDYLFLVAYPAAIGLALARVALRLDSPLRARVQALAWTAPLLTLADATENTALAHVLLFDAGADATRLAAMAATLKFGWLLFLLLALAMTAIVAWRPRR